MVFKAFFEERIRASVDRSFWLLCEGCIDERVGVRFAVLKGRVRVPEDFDAPLPEEMLAEFEGREGERCRPSI